MPHDYIPATGLERDPLDERDFAYRDLVATGELNVDWQKGYSAHEALGLSPIVVDQGGSLSCVGQATAMLLRRWHKKLTGQDVRFSAKGIYSQIHLPDGGAYLRDGVRLVSSLGCPTEAAVPSMENGQAPSEAFMRRTDWMTTAAAESAKAFDRFNYRMIDGATDSIDLFAHAILNNLGVLGGFTGSNPGWTTCPTCRAPLAGESKWGHAIDLPDFGLTDVEECGIPVGTKALFFPNSWGGRYTFTRGRWKGKQAITQAYFDAGAQTAVGYVRGIHVFNSWVLVPDEAIPPSVMQKDLIKQNENKLIQLTEPGVPGSGSMALVADGRVLVIAPERAGQAALTCLKRGVQPGGANLDKKTWDQLPKQAF